ncbi:DEAD/DEAH box helicase [Candidatus Woesearchaeota archaeon]|nr:DEAD/DEAH box helicase [Candidatus Woesearchaeota archaeon]
MNIEELNKFGVPYFVIDKFIRQKITKLNPPQIKAVKAGLLEGKNLLVCTPTGSGKTAIATFAIIKNLNENKGSKAIYLVPLKALASEKYRDYKALLEESGFKAMISTGDLDSRDEWLDKYELLILTIEKMDSLLRHSAPWLSDITTVIIDEIHLLNDPERGPTLEILITILKKLLKNVQIIALSATIGNAEELAEWLNAELVVDDWRPVKLHKGLYFDGKIEFY